MWSSEKRRRETGDGALAPRVLLVACLALSACGFQLRGEPETGIKSLHVSANGGSSVAADIRRALSTGTTKVVATPQEAQAHLKILQEAREKSVYTITATGRVYEHQLRLVVRYELVVPGRELPVIAPAETEARRVLTYSETAPVAKEAEEQLLYRDMSVELAARILRQLALAARDI